MTRTAAKRCLDIGAAMVLLVLCAPVMLAVAIAIRATTTGPALFRQSRVGRHGKPFTLLKFRTMYVNCPDDIHRAYVRAMLTNTAEPPQCTGTAPDSGPRQIFKLQQDPRITPVGRWLRRTSLDELPQLFNVLRGEMSLVGPRPALPWEAELFGPEHDRRYEVAPGLTGLWQVSGRNQLTMGQGLDLDLEYVARQSLALDLQILVRTVPTVLTGRGAL